MRFCAGLGRAKRLLDGSLQWDKRTKSDKEIELVEDGNHHSAGLQFAVREEAK